MNSKQAVRDSTGSTFSTHDLIQPRGLRPSDPLTQHDVTQSLNMQTTAMLWQVSHKPSSNSAHHTVNVAGQKSPQQHYSNYYYYYYYTRLTASSPGQPW